MAFDKKADDRPVAYPKKTENDQMLQNQDEFDNSRQSNRGTEAVVSDDITPGGEEVKGAEEQENG